MRIEASGLPRSVIGGSVFYESPVDRKPGATSGGPNDELPAKVADDYECSTSSSSTSSIGRNSDLSSERSMEDDDSGENEAQSAYKGPLDMMESLEEVLPVRYYESSLLILLEFFYLPAICNLVIKDHTSS